MLKLSARNQVPGTVLEVTEGATTAHMRIEVAPRIVFISAITNEAARELSLKPGDRAVVVVKASDVIIGKEV